MPQAAAQGLSPRSIRKYHTMLHSICKPAVRDQLIGAIPDRYRLLVEIAIETGIRWGELIALRPRHINTLEVGRDQRLFSTSTSSPVSRSTFHTRVWQPAVTTSGVDFAVRMHDLRHAHTSWLLAEGSDLTSVMERMGHAQTP